jgi:hypothetical protein
MAAVQCLKQGISIDTTFYLPLFLLDSTFKMYFWLCINTPTLQAMYSYNIYHIQVLYKRLFKVRDISGHIEYSEISEKREKCGLYRKLPNECNNY